jgi:hypothetical protein
MYATIPVTIIKTANANELMPQTCSRLLRITENASISIWLRKQL